MTYIIIPSLLIDIEVEFNTRIVSLVASRELYALRGSVTFARDLNIEAMSIELRT
jgi:hypothetical protein